MSKSKIDAELEARVEAFVADLSRLIRQSALESVNEALGLEGVKRSAGGRRAGAKPTRASGPGRRAARGGKRVRRSAEDLKELSDAFVAYVAANPGQRLEEIGVGMDLPTKELKRPVQLLLAAKAVRTEGERRGTKYFPGKGGAASGGRKATKRKATKGKRGRRKTAKR